MNKLTMPPASCRPGGFLLSTGLAEVKKNATVDNLKTAACGGIS
jgi:hypothetical protein